MDSLSERINAAWKLLRKKGLVHTKLELGEKIDMKGKSQIYDTFANRDGKLTVSILERIANAFPTVINKNYMLTGEGFIELDEKEYRPHLADVSVAAGFMSGIAEESHEFEMKEFMPQFANYDFSIDVSGESMLPDIHPGDTVFCRIEEDRHADVVGKLCIIDTTEGAVLKIISKEGKDSLTLHSYNPDYKDYKVKFEDIIRIGRIVGLTRKF
ncbi:MAG: hypothetical protein J1E16_09505 [Muribaculaceae bacterium]|nr:hypothetical protein [Muribaculaceae bacterium]